MGFYEYFHRVEFTGTMFVEALSQSETSYAPTTS